MSFHLRPAVRQDIPLIIGVAGPTKSGKTFSAHRLARGMVGPDGKVAMLNAEGRRGHQYVGAPFSYLAADIEPPYSVERYTQAVKEIAAQRPDVLIVDSCSHMHDGPGGMLDEHEAIVQRMSRGDETKRDKMSFAGWVKPKQDENVFIYTLLSLSFPVILCLRAKEKIKIVGGKPIDMGWQPIVSDRVAFETLVTLMLPPHSKGVPDLDISDLRTPFDQLIPKGKPVDEDLGRRFAEWAKGPTATSDLLRRGLEGAARVEAEIRGWESTQQAGQAAPPAATPRVPPDRRSVLISEANDLKAGMPTKDFLDLCATFFDGQRTGAAMSTAPPEKLEAFVDELRKRKGAAA